MSTKRFIFFFLLKINNKAFLFILLKTMVKMFLNEIGIIVMKCSTIIKKKEMRTFRNILILALDLSSGVALCYISH